MNIADLEVAIAEAKRFLAAAEKCKSIQQPCKWVPAGRDAAACKRASMDLTRALADLRHPYRKVSDDSN